MPRPKKLQNIISDQESDESQINENNEEEISISDKSQNTIIQRIEYRDLSAKSVFNFKNFKLEISNFERWYDALRRHLIAQDYQDYIDKELDYDNMTRTQIKYDNAVQSIIVDSLDIETQTLLRGCKTSYQMINILKQQYYKSGQDLINFLLQKIKNLKIKNNDYNLYLNELNTLFEQYDYECDKLKINSLDENTKLLYACTELLSSGFTAYNTYKYKTFKNLKEDLLQTYYHQKRMEDYMSTRNITFSVDDNNNNINQNNINYITNKNSNFKNKNNQFSNKNNKIENNKNFFNKNNEFDYCYICHKNGHNTDNCNLNPLNKNKNNNNIKNYQHKSNRKHFNNNRKFKNKYHSNSVDQDNISETDSDKDELNNYVYFAGNINMENNLNNIENEKSYNKNIKNSSHWIIDSGTGINLTNNLETLSDIKNIKNKLIIYPNGVKDKIIYSGTYNGDMNNNKFKLTNVYYAPKIKNNLISTHHILNQGCKIIMEQYKNKDRLQIFDKDNKIIANIFADEENLFSFDTLNKNINKNFKTNYIDFSLWHSRLGHFCKNTDIEKFVHDHTISHNSKECPQCKISKLKRKPFYASDNFTTQPFELIHSDVVGKLQKSFQGFNYYLTFLDDFTRKCWIYPIINKSDVTQKFIDFNNLVNNLYNSKIKTLKTDNGTEYVNKNLINYLNSKGIELIHSTPGNPQQNGKAERLNQTINNCAKTLLNSVNLPLNFWDSAVICAAKLYNCNPHSGINNKIPDEIFYKKPIDISHFKVFGCKVYFFNNHKTNKFQNNSKPGIFLGYPDNSTGYRVLDLSSNSIITVRDVYFMEDIPGTLQTPFFTSKIID